MTAAAAKKKRPYRRRLTNLQRFDAKHVKGTGGACWEWTGLKMASGYGRFSFGGDHNMGLAHRWSFEHFKGPIPAGLHIDHLCRNPSCVNPNHLEAVTPAVNQARSVPFRKRSTTTHCANGHLWAGGNGRTRAGKLYCRTCANESAARSRAARRSA